MAPSARCNRLDWRYAVPLGRAGAGAQARTFRIAEGVTPFGPSPVGSVRWPGGAITILLSTGPLLLHQRGIPIMDPSAWPAVLATKLGLVAILLLLTLIHDLTLGPRVLQIVQIPMERWTKSEHALVLWSPWVARFSFVLALVILFAAVVLVRF